MDQIANRENHKPTSLHQRVMLMMYFHHVNKRCVLGTLILLSSFCSSFNQSLATGIGYAVSLDGDGGQVRVEHAQSLVMTDVLTIEAWIHPLGPGSGRSGGSGGIIVNKEGEYELARFIDGSIWFAVANEDPGWEWIDSGYVVPEGTWAHLALTYSASMNLFQLFADGRLVSSRTGTGKIGDRWPTINYFTIGARITQDHHFDGLIDEVRVWNIVRTEAEIRATMNTALQGNEPGLAGYWNFDDGTANDLSPNQNHGTLIGNAAIVTITAPVVDIPDLILRGLIETELGKSSGDTITAPEMTTLKRLRIRNSNVGDLTGLEFATNLEYLHIAHGFIRDLSPLVGLTRLYTLYLGANSISDLSPLTGLINLRGLYLYDNKISDISLLAGLTNLESLNIDSNSIPDLSPLAGLTNLDYLKLGNNPISDLSPLAGLTKLQTLHLLRTSVSDLSPLTGLTQLETLSLSNNSISDLSPLVANTGLGDGDTIYVFGNPLSDISINTHIPTLRSRGVTVHRTTLFLPTINPVNVGDTFTIDLIIEDVVNLAGGQLDIEFNSAVLSAISVNEGDLLSKEGGQTFFSGGSIDNANGKITAVSAVFLGTHDISGTGILLSVTFESKGPGEGRIKLHNVKLSSVDRGDLPYEIAAYPFNFKPRHDVNKDGLLNILDLIRVSQNLSQANPQTDVNGDGTVNIFDLIAVSQHLGESIIPLAPDIGTWWYPSVLDSTTIQSWIDRAYAADDGSETFRKGIANLKRLLLSVGNVETHALPTATVLLANYPNPFNPETWIPYRLAADAFVTLTIYNSSGQVVRTLDVGHQTAAAYESRSKAAYWDGRNDLGESVASGLYFYTLTAGDYSATRKMLILR